MSASISLDEARAAKEAAKKLILTDCPDAGIGIAKGKAGYYLKVNLRTPLPKGRSLPTQVNDVPVVVDVVGEIHPRMD